jgi:transposase
VKRDLQEFVAFGFASIHDALAGESALKAAGVPATTIPSPKELGSLCGIALRVRPADARCAEDALSKAGTPAAKKAEILDL